MKKCTKGLAVGHHVKVTIDTEVGGVSLEDGCCSAYQEIEFLLAVQYSLLHASPLVIAEKYHISQGVYHVGHV